MAEYLTATQRTFVLIQSLTNFFQILLLFVVIAVMDRQRWQHHITALPRSAVVEVLKQFLQ